MTIIRRSLRPSHYTVIDNQVLQDKRLSWKAQGLLTYLLSLPDSWQINTKHLSKERSDGKDSTLSGLKELEALGYVKKICVRDDRGRILRWENQVFDLPQSGEGEEPETGEPESGFPDLENPDSGFSRSGKPGDIYINNSNKDLINKKQRERSNAHEDSKISLSLASGSDLNPENLDLPITPALLIEKPETTAEGKTGSAAIVQAYSGNTNGLSENSALPPTFPASSPHEPINEQAWIQAHNSNKPEKWGHLYCGWCFADTMRDAAYAYIKAAGSQQAAIDRHVAALQWIRISGDKREKFFRGLDFSPKQVFNPEKLPMLEFADKASRQNLNPQAVAESGLSESQISAIRAQQREAERQRTGTSLFRHTRANHE
jgi:hypothetical protein